MPLPISDDEKGRLISQIFSLYARHGFGGISMDEVAKQIKLSKATLYKYFKSKETIVRDMVNEITAHLNTLQFTMDGGIDGVLESISAIYFKAVLVAAYSSSKFIADLQGKFPDIYADYIAALDSVQTRFAVFYERATQEGYCKQLSIYLFGDQIKNMLPAIINSAYPNAHDTTLHDVIVEYYKLLLYQLLSAEYMAVVDKDSVYLFVDELVEILESKLLAG